MKFRLYSHKHSPKVLEANDLQSLAEYMKSDSCRNVFLMLGAGKSYSLIGNDYPKLGQASVLPLASLTLGHRRQVGGLYANLARLNLPYPEAVFQIDFFRRNPVPFYTLAKELYPGQYRPTLTHSFIKVLHAHNLLHTCFTQNIDTLERRAGVPERKIVEAHGSFATQRCIECKLPYDDEKIKKAVINSTIPRCERCNGLVKPDIVFFGEALPPRFHTSIHSLRSADLLIVVGTSLTVHPFASLVDLVPDDCPRVLINLDKVGNFSRRDDVILLGRCDDIVRDLCHELGWEQELERAWAETAESVDADDELAVAEVKVKASEEVDEITRDIEKSLTISEDALESLSDPGLGEVQGREECAEVDRKKVEDDNPSAAEGKL